MTVIIYNLSWMPWNLLLAAVSVFLGWLILKTVPPLFKIIVIFFWLLFVPNTIYILTDLYHLTYQWHIVSNSFKFFLALQYFFLIIAGIVTFIISLYFFEKNLLKSKLFRKEYYVDYVIIAVNVLIAFGVVIGRVPRTNSWDVFADPKRVLSDAFYILKSLNLILFVFLYSAVCNLIYFSLKPIISKCLNKPYKTQKPS